MIITLEGNISSGKTTIGEAIAKTGRASFVEEPVGVWQTKYSENLLDLFYKDKKRFAYMFQNAAFLTRAKTRTEILKMTDHSNVVLERSIYSDRFVFARLLHEAGDMLDVEWELYCDMWDWLNERWCDEPDKIVYIRTSAETCFERMGGRGREEETGVSLDYLRLLDTAHEEWLGEANNSCLTNDQEHVIIVDGESEVCVDSLLDKLGIA